MHFVLKKYIMLFCFGILAFFMITIGIRFFSRQLLEKKLHVDSAFTHAVFFDNEELYRPVEDQSIRSRSIPIDWKEMYPFTRAEESDTHSKVRWVLNVPTEIKRSIQAKEKRVEKWTTDYLIGYIFFAEQGRRYENFIGWHIINPAWEIATFSDGYLTSALRRNNNINEYVDSLCVLNDYVKKHGGKLLLVQTPFKVCKYADFDIINKFDYSNANADELLSGLSSNGVSYMDLRDEVHRSFSVEEYHSLFFRTDHHWKPETGLWATSLIVAKLNSDYGFQIDLDLFRLDRYKVDVYSKWFLGSLGKKMTLSRVDPEDCSYILPKFPHKIDYEIPSLGIHTTGTLAVTYDPYQFSSIDYYHKTLYEGYNYSDNAVIKFHNHQITDGKRILMIKDSFANVVAPFLSLGVEDLCMVDTRVFTGSLERFIDEYQPDLVLVITNPSSYARHIDWEQGGSLFDFR